jgi:hypothetical protein
MYCLSLGRSVPYSLFGGLLLPSPGHRALTQSKKTQISSTVTPRYNGLMGVLLAMYATTG